MCDFHDLFSSLSVTFVMYFNGRSKDILSIYFIFNGCRVFAGHQLRST